MSEIAPPTQERLVPPHATAGHDDLVEAAASPSAEV